MYSVKLIVSSVKFRMSIKIYFGTFWVKTLLQHELKFQPPSPFCGEEPRSRRTATLRFIVQPYDENEEKSDQFFHFSK
jgi:hypothetical protein